MIGVGIGIPFFRSFGGGIDAQAQAHFNRVIADGGVVPSGLTGVNAFFSAVKAIYGTSDINTAISAAYDPHYLGYKLGAGSGTTLGQAARTLYAPKGIFGGIGTGSAFYEGTGVSGNFLSTPNAAANQITGDIFMFAYVSNWTNPNAKMVIGKRGAGSTNIAYSLFINADNTIGFRISSDGNSNLNQNGSSSVVIPFTSGWIGLFRNATTGVCTFYTSTNLSTTNPTSITWSQLGTTVNTSSYNIFNANVPLSIGQYSVTSASEMFQGLIYSAGISTSVNGTPTQIFNANQYTGANTWTSTTGEVWTVNSTGAGLADVTQTTAASQPLLLAHTGENYWFGSGVSGNFVTTPNAAVNQITGDIEIVAQVKITNQSNTQTIIAKNVDGSNFSYWFGISAANQLRFIFSQNGISTITATSTIVQPFSTSQIGFVKVTKVSSTGIVKFFTSTDGITYTQLGADVASTSGAMFAGNASVKVGAYDTANLFPFFGTIYRATISNSIGGTPVVDFNPSSYNPATSQTQWTSATGEVWSINVGTAATGYKSALVTKSIVQADGIDDTLLSGVLTNVQYHSLHLALNPFNIPLSGGVYYMDGGSASGLIYGISDSLSSFNGTELAFIGDLEYRIQYCHVDFNNTTSNVYLNNSNNVLGATGTRTSTRNNLFSSGSGSSFANAIISTAIRASVIDNSTQRTALYDYVRQINNNAF